MRIGFDAVIYDDLKSGSRERVYQLSRSLMRIAPESDYIFYTHRDYRFQESDPFQGGRYVKTPLIWWNTFQRILRGRFFWKKRLLQDRVEVFDTSSIPLSVFPRAVKVVLTIHDLRYHRFPKFFSRRRAYYSRFILPFNVRKAHRIITVSRYIKGEIEKYLRVPSEKIEVIPNAVSQEFSPVGDEEKREAVREKYGLPRNFLLYVGHLEARKNLARLIHAYSLLQHPERREEKLVIAGDPRDQFHVLMSVVSSLNLHRDVVFPGYVKGEDLPALYSMAAAFVLPSLYEGFGIPSLEAMACGTPVVASNTSGIPEAVGDAAILVDPMDSEDIARGLYEVLSNPARREELVKRGHARTREYTWEDAGRRTLEVYKSLLEG